MSHSFQATVELSTESSAYSQIQSSDEHDILVEQFDEENKQDKTFRFVLNSMQNLSFYANIVVKINENNELVVVQVNGRLSNKVQKLNFKVSDGDSIDFKRITISDEKNPNVFIALNVNLNKLN